MLTTNNSPLFALDIGTRSVVGLLLSKANKQYELIDSIAIEHTDRTMLDGQIHDIPSVANVISEVKSYFEKRHGPLNSVCVAAAGRSLKTRKAKVSIDITNDRLLDEESITHLELSAVQQAQFHLANDPNDDVATHYYCVGYSVLTYTLDGETIGSLLDQTGERASVEVIATFLPIVVIESLLAALSRANLSLEALTLEPIAAIDVLIPNTMRRLNVALVDIGAGTSDIAITDDNTVIAYGMVPIAGDEVTEAISDHFLLDFPDAEKVKRELAFNETIQVTDILGMEMNYERNEIVSSLKETVFTLAQSISNEILSLNGKAPKAVMLIGGGSLTPLLPQYIAKNLGLSENRVAIREADAIKIVQNKGEHPIGPDLVTPIGIAIAAKKNPIKYVKVTVNEKTIRLFDVKKLTVGDGLLASGLNIKQLYGKPGLAMTVTVQDKLISIPGKHGKPPLILNNGKKVTLDEPLHSGDVLTVKQGKSGEDAKATIAELIDNIPSFTCEINGEKRTMHAAIFQNGQKVTPHANVNDRDEIKIVDTITIRDLLQLEGISPSQFTSPYFYINGEKWEIKSENHFIYVNDERAPFNQPVMDGDHISWQNTQNKTYTVEHILKEKQWPATTSIVVFYNDEPITLEKSLVQVRRGEETLSLSSVVHIGEHLTITKVKKEPFILQDIFTVVNVDLSNVEGKTVLLKQNDKETNFASPLHNGDRIELTFVDMKTGIDK